MLITLARFFTLITIASSCFASEGKEDNSNSKDSTNSIFSALEQEESVREEQKAAGELYNTAEIKVIDKKMGKVDTVLVNIQKPIIFNEEIAIRVLACWKEKEKKLFPDSKALVEFYSVSQEEELEKKFGGWIFSKNPGISAYSTEKYEFMLRDCMEK